MNLLLIQPPIEDFYDTDIRLQPLGLAFLKAVLRRFHPDVEVKIIDFHHGYGKRTIAIPQELAYLKDYYTYADESPFCTFNQYYRFGASEEQIRKRLSDEAPDLVAVSSLFTPYYREALRVCALAKTLARPPLTLLGGSHVSAMPEFTLQHPEVDFVIRGEGEQPLVQFVKVLAEGTRAWSEVSGLGFKEGERLIFNPQSDNFAIEELPVPDLSDLNPEKYRFHGRPLTFMVTSRSCPHRCSFCSVHTTFGTKYRRRGLENILAEIRARYAEGYRVIDFEDDNLTVFKGPMKELCRRLIEEFPARDLQLVAMNGISYLSLDTELLELMRQAGFTHLNLALVSSDSTVLESTKRPHTVKKYLETVRVAFELGFHITSYQILGLPFESLTSMIQTLVFAAQQPVLLGASMFYQIPNSPIAATQTSFSPTDLFRARLTAMAIETEGFQREDLYTLFICTRIINFLKGFAIDPDTTLNDLFDQRQQFPVRDRIGLELLESLVETGNLYAHTRKGRVRISRFREDLFAQVWRGLKVVCCQNGQMLDLSRESALVSNCSQTELHINC